MKSWLRRVSKPNETALYLFFAGHGLASDNGKNLYLLPYDGRKRLLEKTAILKVDGAFVDFHAKDIVNIVNDLLANNFINFILNLSSCTDLNNYGVSILISLVGSIKQKDGKLFFTNLNINQEKI